MRMFHQFVLTLAVVLFLSSAQASLQNDKTDPGQPSQFSAEDIVGDWMVNTGDAVVRFYEKQGSYHGKVVWAGRESVDWWFDDAPMEIPWENRRAAKKLKHAASLGVDIITGLDFDGTATWANGRVFNVLNGKIYKCQLSLPEEGVLKLRGFIGVPLFGGSVLWHKLEDSQRAEMPSFPNRFEHPETWP